MYLYNLTLQRSTGITHAIHGNFSGAKLQEIVVSRGKILELMRPDPNTGKVYTLLTHEVFGVVRSLMPFRLTGGSKGNTIKFKITIMHNIIFCFSFRLYRCRIRLWTNSHHRIYPRQEYFSKSATFLFTTNSVKLTCTYKFSFLQTGSSRNVR